MIFFGIVGHVESDSGYKVYVSRLFSVVILYLCFITVVIKKGVFF